MLYSDIWRGSKFDVLDVFHKSELKYFTKTDGKKSMRHDVFERRDISEMKIETRPTYPSDRLTFAQANISRALSIRYFNICVPKSTLSLAAYVVIFFLIGWLENTMVKFVHFASIF